ncbi:hypothetical protein ABEB22_01160 [Thioclava sp. 'Guangxiensis']|uniref:hypothetical protein n=1 Tax=Thioclava sp. 'Guangxiensis' TaxID=3149044 RepID=UPI00387840EE
MPFPISCQIKARPDLLHSPAAPREASNLRDALRLRLAPAHASIDTAFSTLDLTEDGDYRIFLRAHHDALMQMARAMQGQPPSAGTALLADLLAAIGTDLRELDGPPASPTAPPPTAPLHPLAFDYILFGSRLGNQVLAKRRVKALAAKGRTESANRYLCHPFDPRLWQSFLHQATNIPVENRQTDCIIADAERCFGWFSMALSQHVTPPTDPQHHLRAQKAPL